MIFITGGTYTNQDSGTTLSESEYVDLPDGSIVSCRAPAPLPNATHAGATLKTSEGNILVCGGDVPKDACQEYDPKSNTWYVGPTMLQERFGPASTEIADGSYWILSGGGGALSTTTEIYTDGTFIEGPSLAGLSYSTLFMCAAALSDELTFVGANEGAFIYNWATEEFENITSGFEFSALQAQCGTFIAPDGSKQLVVAGGAPDIDRSRILDVETRIWREGPQLPFPIQDAAVLQDENTFIILGGLNSIELSMDTIVEFTPEDETWKVKDETLSSEKHFIFAAFVDSEEYC